MMRATEAEPKAWKLMLVLFVALAVLGGTSYWGMAHLRGNIRQQMINNDGEELYAVAQAQQFLGGEPANPEDLLQNPADQLALALNISQLKDGVLAVRLFRADGTFVTALPPQAREATMDATTLAALAQLHTFSRYRETARLADVFLPGQFPEGGSNLTPLLEVSIPIHVRGQAKLLAGAQLILDARQLAHQFSVLDRQLWVQTSLAFLGGASLLCGSLILAYRHLRKSNIALQERTDRLLRANQELALAAKTNALGAVTAHLVHGLSSPLANLQDFIANRDRSDVETDWSEVADATQRMQKLVYEIVRVLGEQNSADSYEITLPELLEVLSAKVQPAVKEAGVTFTSTISATGKLANRHANLVLLILENLTRNALEVSAPGKNVHLSVIETSQSLLCEVADEGPGLPDYLVAKLFTPCRSTKGSNGLGLAISKQLANQLGGQLTLNKTGRAGSVFALELPRLLMVGEQKLVKARIEQPVPV